MKWSWEIIEKIKGLLLRTTRGKRKGAKLEEIEELEWRNGNDVNKSLKKQKTARFFQRMSFIEEEISNLYG
jgi:hypothetical protein